MNMMRVGLIMTLCVSGAPEAADAARTIYGASGNRVPDGNHGWDFPPGNVYYIFVHTPIVSTWVRFARPMRYWLGRTSAEWAEWWSSWTNEEWATSSLRTRVQGRLWTYGEWLTWYQGFSVQDWANWVQNTGHHAP